MTNAGRRSPSRPRDGPDSPSEASGSTPAHLARSGALALAAAATCSRPRGLLLPAALRPLLGGRGVVALGIGILFLLLVRFLARLAERLGLGGRDARGALLFLLRGGLDQLEIGRLARIPEPVADPHDARVAAVSLGVP